jgi:hypothetical protein
VVELSPEEQARMRALEDEVDKERETLRKQREELEKKALVVVDQPAEKASLPAKREEPTTLPAPSPWRKNLRRNVTIGAAAVMAGFFVLHNLVFIIGSAIVVGGVWYASGKYIFKDDAQQPDESQGKKTE